MTTTSPRPSPRPSRPLTPFDAWMSDLREEYGLTMTMAAVASVLKMSKHSVMAAIYAGRFPIQTFRAGQFRLAKTEDVAQYLANCEASG